MAKSKKAPNIQKKITSDLNSKKSVNATVEESHTIENSESPEKPETLNEAHDNVQNESNEAPVETDKSDEKQTIVKASDLLSTKFLFYCHFFSFSFASLPRNAFDTTILLNTATCL